MTYAGELSDRDGKAVNTTVEASFRIFDAKTAGSEAWSEPASTVDVKNGHFSVQLGAKTSLKDVFDGKAYWLEISLDGSALSPRTPIESIPYAFQAHSADKAISADNANTLQGKTPEQIIALAKAGGVASANDLVYDNSLSGLSATNIQAALDELAALRAEVSALKASTKAIESNSDKIIALEALTKDMKHEMINGKEALTFTGVNIHIRSGSGFTNGTGKTEGSVNGLGNLIVGYDELADATTNKSGSHNLVIGSGDEYTSFGGFVAGINNTITGMYASVSGGRSNKASGEATSVSGGITNTAFGDASSVSGGSNNRTSGHFSSISGGDSNITTGLRSSVSGGDYNNALGETSSVCGGSENTSGGMSASIGGGYKNVTANPFEWIAGL